MQPPVAGDTEETQLIKAILNGETERYAELVDRHQTAAIRLAFGVLGDWEDAKDAAQEAFVSAYRGLARFRFESKFSTWLYRIVMNKCKDWKRGRARLPLFLRLGAQANDTGTDDLFIDIADMGPGPERRARERELTVLVSRAVRRLSDKQREVFVLHHLQGLTLEEAAAVLGCRAGTVKSHLFRAHESLKRLLEPSLKGEV